MIGRRAEPRAWVLNLDAEHELEAAGRYQPTARVREIVAREARRLIGPLVRPGDVVLEMDDARAGEGARAERPAPDARGMPGFAWSPTPRALARLEAAGARPAPTPPLEVLRAVNARAFARAVRAPLAEASFRKDVATTLEEARALLARPAELGWLVRRGFGAAGRGRRRLATGEPTEAERAWLVASLRRGPLIVEPWVRITREHTRCAWLARDGALTILAPGFQATSASGGWLFTEPTERGALSRADDHALERAVAAAGEALAAAGYFGPFGIDAFHHLPSGLPSRLPSGRARGGRAVLNALGEINARYTMDWPAEGSAGLGE